MVCCGLAWAAWLLPATASPCSPQSLLAASLFRDHWSRNLTPLPADCSMSYKSSVKKFSLIFQCFKRSHFILCLLGKVESHWATLSQITYIWGCLLTFLLSVKSIQFLILSRQGLISDPLTRGTVLLKLWTLLFARTWLETSLRLSLSPTSRDAGKSQLCWLDLGLLPNLTAAVAS